jgi:hypothetical protein
LLIQRFHNAMLSPKRETPIRDIMRHSLLASQAYSAYLLCSTALLISS